MEKKFGKAKLEKEQLDVVDLPGVYTLDASSLDEKVTRDYILNKRKEEKADVFALVVDSTNSKKKSLSCPSNQGPWTKICGGS